VSEILTRSDGTFTEINFAERLIDLIAVPWGQTARVFWRGDFWDEVFERGAFRDIRNSAGRVRVNREHRKGDTVGKVVEFDPDDDRGLFARIKVARGPKGDELLHLAADDMVSASIGYRTNNPSDVVLNKETRTRRVVTAFLDHLGMVEDPAYEGARVLAVRKDDVPGIEVAAGPLPATPVLDEMLRDPILAWAMEQRRAS
jgi:HK97 family phage prohead protease